MVQKKIAFPQTAKPTLHIPASFPFLTVLFKLFMLDTVCSAFTTSMYCIYQPCISAAAALYVVAIPLLLLQPPLHASVRDRVPDGKSCCCGSLHLILVFSFSSYSKTIYF